MQGTHKGMGHHEDQNVDKRGDTKMDLRRKENRIC